jgi:tRNA (5-methylaminomethyl-2-thiouridylate)-methyltransferase
VNIAALLSGGVDSSVVVHLLKEAGYTPTLFYIKIGMDDDELLHCSSEEDIEMASLIARKYGCKLEVVDLYKDYWDNVVSYTIDKVRQGLTPNPDVMCNKLIKFGVFEQRVGKEFDKTATGHYATTFEQNGKIYLGTANDPVKDQTDFLAQINYLQVSKLMFPIGHLMKSKVREIAVKAALPSAKRQDSQGICFLGKVNYNDFIKRYLGEKTGPIVELETGKILGKHNGYWFHTVGQRKGLGLSGGPWYVIKKDIEANIVYASKGFDVETQYGHEFSMRDFHFITDNPWTSESNPIDITFKIRHTPDFTHGKIIPTTGGVHLISDQRLQGIAPGQFGVIYDAESRICIGSGEIM